MGLRCDDIKLCAGNCHLHIADAVSHVSPKNGRYKKLASNFWPKIAWRRVGKAEVEVEVDADMVEEKQAEEKEEEEDEEEEEEEEDS